VEFGWKQKDVEMETQPRFNYTNPFENACKVHFLLYKPLARCYTECANHRAPIIQTTEKIGMRSGRENAITMLGIVVDTYHASYL
jgi:hypothetical protein